MENEQRKEELNNVEAAEYLGFTPATLAASRYTRKLSGVLPPKHFKRGHIFYKKATLDTWLAQFEEQE